MGMANPKNTGTLAVIGAGLAGLAAASRLAAQGHAVTLIDKARGVGGRMATKRFGELRVDTGAQFFTVTDTRFQQWLAPLIAAGEAFEWTRGFALWRDGKITPRPDGHVRYACRSGMSAVAKRLADDARSAGAQLLLGQPASTLKRDAQGYTVTLQDGTAIQAGRVVLNLPPEQLLALAGHLLDPQLATAIRACAFDPCFAIYCALAEDLRADWKGLELEGHPVFSWIARDHTRRAPDSPPVLVAHTTPEWSRRHLEENPECVATLAGEALRELLPEVQPSGTPAFHCHRWRYARPTQTLEAPLADPRLAICGDWTLAFPQAGRVEGAFISGFTLLYQGHE